MPASLSESDRDELYCIAETFTARPGDGKGLPHPAAVLTVARPLLAWVQAAADEKGAEMRMDILRAPQFVANARSYRGKPDELVRDAQGTLEFMAGPAS